MIFIAGFGIAKSVNGGTAAKAVSTHYYLSNYPNIMFVTKVVLALPKF